MKASFPFDFDSIALLENIARLTPRRKYHPSYLKLMQTTMWDNHLGKMAQHCDFELVVQEIITHNKQFSRFYDVTGVESVSFSHDHGDKHLHERTRSRQTRFQYSEFGGSNDYLPIKSTWYTTRDRNLSSSRSCRVYVVAALVRDWPVSISQHQNLIARIENWNYIKTCGPDLGEDAYTNLLKLRIKNAWDALYDLSRKTSRENNKYKLVLLFCTLAFGKGIKLRDIKPF